MKYCITRIFGGGKLGEFGKSSMICQTKIIQFSTYINSFLADLFIHQIFCQNLVSAIFTIQYSHQTFLLYGTSIGGQVSKCVNDTAHR